MSMQFDSLKHSAAKKSRTSKYRVQMNMKTSRSERFCHEKIEPEYILNSLTQNILLRCTCMKVMHIPEETLIRINSAIV